MPTLHFAIFATDRPGCAATRERLREIHRVYIRTPDPDDVVAVLGGPTLDADGRMNGTLLVVRAPTLAAARRFIEADPYSRNGLFENVEVRAWRWGLGLCADLDSATNAPA